MHFIFLIIDGQPIYTKLMTQFSTLLGYGLGSLLGVIATGWILYSFYDLFRYLCFLLFRIQRTKKPKTRFIADVFKYFLIGLPIIVVGNIYSQQPDVRLGAVMLLLTILWYILMFFLLRKIKSTKSKNELTIN